MANVTIKKVEAISICVESQEFGTEDPHVGVDVDETLGQCTDRAVVGITIHLLMDVDAFPSIFFIVQCESGALCMQ